MQAAESFISISRQLTGISKLQHVDTPEIMQYLSDQARRKTEMPGESGCHDMVALEMNDRSQLACDRMPDGSVRLAEASKGGFFATNNWPPQRRWEKLEWWVVSAGNAKNKCYLQALAETLGRIPAKRR